MKKICLFGGSGQLGSSLQALAAEFNFQIHAPAHKEIDIRQPKSVKSYISNLKPDFVINAAAFHVVPDCENQPLAAFDSNCVAVAHLATICNDLNIEFVTFSTDYVFDGRKEGPYAEGDRPNPLQMYGITKYAGELAALNLCPMGSYIIRTCGVYGGEAGSSSKGGNFALNIIKEARAKPTLEVSSDQIVNPTFAPDLARSTLELLDLSAEPGIYHLTNEGSCSWFDFATETLANAKINIPIKPVNRHGQGGGVRRPKFSALANIKAKKLGITLPAWQDGLSRYIKELEAYGKI